MGDFEIGRLRGAKRNDDRSGKHGRERTDIHEFSSLTETLPEKLSAIDFLTQQPARKIFFSACDCYPYLSKSQETCIYGANLCGQYRSALHDINDCYSLYIYKYSQKNPIATLRSRKKSVRFPSIQPMRLSLP
jgi:hypothetical protein